MMEIDGEVYRKDVIILPDGSIHHPWWRTSGHVLTLADIQIILAAAPAFLVVGTGATGMMKPEAGFKAANEAKGIQTTILPTDQAVHEFSRISAQSGSCAGCFHLTC
jgi:hypothetical protein